MKLLLVFYILGLFLWSETLQAQPSTTWYSMDVSGANLSVKGFDTLCSSIGQSIVGSATKGSSILNSGFLSFVLGTKNFVSIEQSTTSIPASTSFYCYPNPCTGLLTLECHLNKPSYVRIAVQNYIGQQIAIIEMAFKR